MRVPIRKGDARVFAAKDYYLTQDKYQKTEAEITKLKQYRPQLAQEVKRLAEMGDFSENAGYQMAKGRLRGLNQRLLELEDRIKKAEIIEVNSDVAIVQIGHSVELLVNNEHKNYTILGGSESNPLSGVISHLSPLGSALLGCSKGDVVVVKDKEYKIISIN